MSGHMWYNREEAWTPGIVCFQDRWASSCEREEGRLEKEWWCLSFASGWCCPTCCCMTQNYIFSEVRTKSSCFHCPGVRSGNRRWHKLFVASGPLSVLKVTAQVISIALPTRLYCIRRHNVILCCAVLSRRQRSCDIRGGWIAVIHKRAPRLLGSWLQTPILPVSCCPASSTAELLSPRPESLTYSACLLWLIRGVVERQLWLNVFDEGSIGLYCGIDQNTGVETMTDWWSLSFFTVQRGFWYSNWWKKGLRYTTG